MADMTIKLNTAQLEAIIRDLLSNADGWWISRTVDNSLTIDMRGVDKVAVRKEIAAWLMRRLMT